MSVARVPPATERMSGKKALLQTAWYFSTLLAASLFEKSRGSSFRSSRKSARLSDLPRNGQAVLRHGRSVWQSDAQVEFTCFLPVGGITCDQQVRTNVSSSQLFGGIVAESLCLPSTLTWVPGTAPVRVRGGTYESARLTPPPLTDPGADCSIACGDVGRLPRPVRRSPSFVLLLDEQIPNDAEE